jgi:peptidoglycan/LPS O-acetylase OafA/YrhL
VRSPTRALTAYGAFEPLLLGLMVAAGLLGWLELTKGVHRIRIARALPVLYGAFLFLPTTMDAVRPWGANLFTGAVVPKAMLTALVVVLPAALAIGWLVDVAFANPIRKVVSDRMRDRKSAPRRARRRRAHRTSRTSSKSTRSTKGTTSRRRMLGSKNIAHLTALDHLRAFAALLVLMYHSHEGLGGAVAPGDCRGPLWSLLLQGHTGVGLFMVLSGFVFTHGAQGRTVLYWKFIYNRFLRVYPLFIFLLIATISTYRASLSGLTVLQSLLTLGNLPGAANWANTLSTIAWTLSPEFQFYLVFPFLFRAMEGPGARRWVVAFFLALLAGRLLVYGAGGDPSDMIYWTVFGRMGQFMIGMLAARAYHRWGGGHAALFPIALALVLALHQYTRQLAAGRWWAATVDLWQGLAWAFVLVTYIPVAHRLPRAISVPLTHLGTISYSLYLLHYSLIVAFNLRHWYTSFVPDRHWNALIVFGTVHLPLLVLASTLTYHVIEKPFLQMRVRYLG